MKIEMDVMDLLLALDEVSKQKELVTTGAIFSREPYSDIHIRFERLEDRLYNSLKEVAGIEDNPENEAFFKEEGLITKLIEINPDGKYITDALMPGDLNLPIRGGKLK